MRHRIFVGLSGGVDSAVAAALLKEKGYDVVGVFIKIWQPEFLECNWREERLDAMRVCAALDIPFLEVDFSEQYKTEVVEAMIADYARGITPNPDVLCNRSIKFGHFAQWARAQGAQAVATGHYAQKASEGGHLELRRARDLAKDQSYFLYTLTQQDLTRTIFPIGEMRKAEVRKLAQRFNLPIANKPDSQGLCFVGEVTMPDFLARYIPLSEGRVLDMKGRVVGRHSGAALYTLGQRHGFTTEKAYGRLPADRQVPYFVVGVDVAMNTIRVSARREDAACRSVALEHVSWVHREPKEGMEIVVQARYHEEPVGAKLQRQGQLIAVIFEEPHIASRGQSLVVYQRASGQDDICLGGGTIATLRSGQPKGVPKKIAVRTAKDTEHS